MMGTTERVSDNRIPPIQHRVNEANANLAIAALGLQRAVADIRLRLSTVRFRLDGSSAEAANIDAVLERLTDLESGHTTLITASGELVERVRSQCDVIQRAIEQIDRLAGATNV